MEWSVKYLVVPDSPDRKNVSIYVLKISCVFLQVHGPDQPSYPSRYDRE